ncbi:MAG: acetylornithine deacetylase [Myxococcaceae bacterium]|nr:acetylornithine deacetylase [Myxococcaceae bacterium]
MGFAKRHSLRIERIARLVAQPSVSSSVAALDQSNRGVIDLLADMLDCVGFRVEILPLPNAPHKANLIATFGRGQGGLVLAGHTDTVPYDAALWNSDPFKLQVRDGKLYGLGAADMKAFLALALEAVSGLDADTLRAPLIVLATAEEETTMEGARALVELQRPKARHAIIGEPTDMRAVRAHKGHLVHQLRVVGRSGHSSDPRLGSNAIDGMTRVLGALMELREALASRYHDASFALPMPTLNFGRIRGGDNANRICGDCELDLDVRLVPGMELDWVRDEISRVAIEALAGTGLLLEQRPLDHGVPPYQVAAQSELLRTLEELTGEGAESVAFGTEAPYFAALGMDTMVLGPGSIEQAHCPDEFVRADRLEPTVQMLQAVADRLCKTAPR